MTGTVAVAGLGLIGGSLARDLAARGVRVLGWDRDPAALDAALAAEAVHAPLEPGGGAEAEVAVLAVPVLAAPAVLARIVQTVAPSAVLTDAGSTKGGIVRAAEALGVGARFVGAHPLAGDHRSGWGASRDGLFRGARVYLTPGPRSRPDAVGRVRALWEGVGGEVEEMDAEAHDLLLAWSSHLPQVVSSALAAALARAGIPRAALGPGGRDVTRLAASSPALWAEVCADNREALAEALRAAEAELRQVRAAVDRGEAEPLRRWFEAGRGWSG